jgi:hypothetical protein
MSDDTDQVLVRFESTVGERVIRFEVPGSLLGGRYRAFDSPELLDTRDPAPRLLGFASTGFRGVIALDVETGKVVEFHGEGPVTFVNTSLERFVATARAVHDRFPFYARGASDDDMDAAADDLLRVIGAIDPPAARVDQFWSTLVDDVRMGDFSTEDVQVARGRVDS